MITDPIVQSIFRGFHSRGNLYDHHDDGVSCLPKLLKRGYSDCGVIGEREKGKGKREKGNGKWVHDSYRRLRDL